MPYRVTVRARDIVDLFGPKTPAHEFLYKERKVSSVGHDSMRAAVLLRLHRDLRCRLDENLDYFRIPQVLSSKDTEKRVRRGR